jgi:hypothetical protein
MKKILLFLLSFVSVLASAQTPQTATFDFSNPPSLNPPIEAGTEKGDWCNVRGYTFTSGDVSIYCGSNTQLGLIDIYTSQNPATQELNYHLELCRNTYITVSVPSGSYITGITFTGAVAAIQADTGSLTSQGIWTPGSTNPSQVTFTNLNNDPTAIETITVNYTAPSAILYPYSVNIIDKDGKSSAFESGMEVESFKSLALDFGGSMSVLNASGVTMVQTDNNNTPVSVTVTTPAGKPTISVATPITTDGAYAISVAERSFSNGTYQNAALPAYTFMVRQNRKTLTKESATIDPAEGEVESLPNPVKLTFAQPIMLNTEIPTVDVLKDGEFYMTANLAVTGDDQSTLEISYTGTISAMGTYVYQIPEGAIHNTAYGTPSAAANDRWNPAFVLTYSVVTPPDPLAELKAEAAQLAQNIGKVGYPDAASAGATQIAAVNANPDATQEELENAIKAFLEETDVVLPAKDGWYFIAGVNDANPQEKLYLKFLEEGTKVTLTSSQQEAAAFQVFEVNAAAKTLVFKSKDGKYLHVPHTLPNYEVDGVTLTDEQSDINTLTLNKFLLEGKAKELQGTFTIYGGLGKKGSTDKFAYLLYQYDGWEILTDPDLTEADLIFTAVKSNAYIFEETTEPSSEVNVVTPEVMLNPIVLANAGDLMRLSVLNVKSAVVKDATKPYFVKDGVKVNFSGTILTPIENSETDFYVNTNGLASGIYGLMMPEGTFTFEAIEEGKTVKDMEMKADFTITHGAEGQVTPQAVLSPRTLKAGEALTLTILNVKSATIKDASKPRFIQNGQQVAFSGTILTKTGDCTFSVNTAGLAAGSYGLLLPSGTFTFVAETTGQVVSDIAMTTDFTITDEGGGGGGGGGGGDTHDFKKDYVFYQYPDYPADRAIPAVDLNYFGIFVYLGVNHADLCVDSSKKVKLGKWYDASQTIREGHLALDTEYGKGNPAIKAYKIVWEPAVKPEDVPFETECSIIIPEATFGDEKFGQWLNNHSSVAESECHVNGYYARFVIVDNNATGITNINLDTKSAVIFDLQGRRVQNMDQKGVYIVNGCKVVKK